MNIVPSQQTLILANERVPTRHGAAGPRALNITIIAAHPDDTVVYLHTATHAPPVGWEPPASEVPHPDLPVIAAEPALTTVSVTTRQSRLSTTSSRALGLYASTQRGLGDATGTQFLDVHA